MAPRIDSQQNMERSNAAIAFGTVVEHGSSKVIVALAKAAVLFELSMGMGKIRSQIVNGNGNSAKETPADTTHPSSNSSSTEPFVRENPGKHAIVNNLARKKTWLGGTGFGRRWRKNQKRGKFG